MHVFTRVRLSDLTTLLTSALHIQLHLFLSHLYLTKKVKVDNNILTKDVKLKKSLAASKCSSRIITSLQARQEELQTDLKSLNWSMAWDNVVL